MVSFLRKGAFFSMNASTPTFSKPIALSMPHAVSAIRGGRLPLLGLRERPFTTAPPNLFKSTKDLNSMAYPKVPEAVITGFWSLSPPISTVRSGWVMFTLFYKVIIVFWGGVTTNAPYNLSSTVIKTKFTIEHLFRSCPPNSHPIFR